MRPDALIFDLDGTLWDTCETCAAAWNRVVGELRIVAREVTAGDIRAVAGLPHTEGVRRVFTELSAADVLAISERTMIEDNRALAQSGGTLYRGVSEWIRSSSSKLPLMIVSNCQAGYIEIFLETSGLVECFVDFECWGNTGLGKAENIRAVVARNRLRSPWFIGDTEGDRSAARENGLFFVHAAYGFGTVVEADAAIAAFDELSALLVE